MESWAIYMLLAWLVIFTMMGWSISRLLRAEQGQVS